MYIDFQEVELCFGDNNKQVLANLSFSLEKGKTLAIVGASGSGKSTTLRLLSGILPRDIDIYKGSISIDHQEPADYLENKSLSFMFQDPTLFPNLTVQENIRLPLEIHDTVDSARIDALITKVGLESYKHYLPKNLSGGMKTRVALARSFITQPELLLLDEPFSALDVAWKDALYTELKTLIAENNTTVVFVTHDIDEAMKLADTIMCIGSDGNIIFRSENTREPSLRKEITEIIINNHHDPAYETKN